MSGTRMSRSYLEQIKFAGEAKRDLRAEGYLESSVVEPGHQNAAACGLSAEQRAGLLKLPVPRSGVLSFDGDTCGCCGQHVGSP